LQGTEDTDNSISIQVDSSAAGSSLRVNSEMEGDEEPTLEAEMRERSGTQRDARTIKMETDSEDSSQEEGEQQIRFKKRPNH
jgi:hypothetical protein